MFDRLTYKNKCMALFGGFLLFLFVAYEFSLSDTLKLSSDIKEKEQKLSWLKEKEKELPALKARMAEFEKAYSKNDSLAVRDKLTEFISDFAEKNNCLVTEIPLNSSFKNDNLHVQTNSFTIKGNFNNLLTLLYRLESDCRYVAKIMSSRFYTVKDIQSKRKYLYLTIITQSFEQKNI
jgi:hypothetical protein